MARVLVPVVKCDHCGGTLDPMVRSDSIVLSVDGRKRELVADLCDAGRELLLKEFDELNTRFAFSKPQPDTKKTARVRTTKKPASSDNNMDARYRTCLECNFVSKNRTALSVHVRDRHGSSLKMSAHPLP